MYGPELKSVTFLPGVAVAVVDAGDSANEPMRWFSTFSMMCGEIPSCAMRLAVLRRKSCRRQGGIPSCFALTSAAAISLSSRVFALLKPETGLPEPLSAGKNEAVATTTEPQHLNLQEIPF